jgi:hypothetical protein
MLTNDKEPPDIHGPTTVCGRVQGWIGIPGQPIGSQFEIRADMATRHFRIIGSHGRQFFWLLSSGPHKTMPIADNWTVLLF